MMPWNNVDEADSQDLIDELTVLANMVCANLKFTLCCVVVVALSKHFPFFHTVLIGQVSSGYYLILYSIHLVLPLKVHLRCSLSYCYNADQNDCFGTHPLLLI